MIAGLAALLAALHWRNLFVGLGVAHLALAPLIFAALPKQDVSDARASQPAQGMALSEAASRPLGSCWRLRDLWFDDFFVATHVVAFAQDRGVDALVAGDLLASWG